eukprot:2570430-Lingulodinium_polyedra.AAC.1
MPAAADASRGVRHLSERTPNRRPTTHHGGTPRLTPPHFPAAACAGCGVGHQSERSPPVRPTRHYWSTPRP